MGIQSLDQRIHDINQRPVEHRADGSRARPHAPVRLQDAHAFHGELARLNARIATNKISAVS